MALIRALSGSSGGGGAIDLEYKAVNYGIAPDYNSFQFNNLEVGKHYLINCFMFSSTALNWNRCDIVSITGGSYEKYGNMQNMTSGTATLVGSYNYVTAESTSITITVNDSAICDIIQVD